ncbi:hypothetical protein A2415_02460 [candidate division WWE3 bacterium RIFOXYC1_FULL_39_7]|uniref:4Fe-4S ferredoxin-type domain-containing protein n=2 Tax=Katanobacteria TaxID=422282 RepID=A0A1F4X7F1_UNCKA|nr:MAG: hypothetical protein A2415_02460 [candidate division WWE3 bacterium RIFOXYC1_FULL_39_7]OGC77572.1 MAG: hypothetical protein A2619_01065 [candidate division WWE3 bacterium RIFOXYD1_FULL_39_9]
MGDKIHKVKINSEKCIACGVCMSNDPNFFKLNEEKNVTEIDYSAKKPDDYTLEMIAQMCPVGAIEIYDENGNLITPNI